jgi:steroid 5-alpha reductase family enzyme
VTRAHLLIIVSYMLALAAAWFTLPFVSEYHVMVQVLIADVVATIVIFAFSFAFSNSSFYDAYWSVIPIAIVAYLVALPGDAETLRQLMLALVIGLWGVRLTANWAYTWSGLDHVDWRYINLQEQSGILWWPLSFAGVHLFPTILVFLGCIPMYHALVIGDHPINVFDYIALAVGLVSVWIEFQSDRELHRFRETRSSRAEVLDTGLWAWCRHPNYLGEIGVWVSVLLFGYAAVGYLDYWMLSGAVSMVLLFTVVSIPMIEKKLAADKPGYADYKARSFSLMPLSKFKR